MRFAVFEKSLTKSATLLQKYNFDLFEVILDGTEETFENVLNSFVSIAAIQVRLSKIFKLPTTSRFL